MMKYPEDEAAKLEKLKILKSKLRQKKLREVDLKEVSQFISGIKGVVSKHSKFRLCDQDKKLEKQMKKINKIAKGLSKLGIDKTVIQKL